MGDKNKEGDSSADIRSGNGKFLQKVFILHFTAGHGPFHRKQSLRHFS